jgi:nuclear GTP-binding protein
MSSLSNTKPKGTNFYRTEKKTKQLKVLNSGKAKRNAKGEIIKEAIYQSKLPSGTRARVEPNRKWFENTRTISSKELLNYDLATKVNNPFEYVIRSKQLPVELIQQPKNIQPSKMLLKIENFMNFKDVFGPNQKRKRPNISQTDYNELATNSSKRLKDYDSDNDNYDQVQEYQYEKNPIFQKGQSKRIWGELYKVIDSSDVLIHVLDARDPLGTRCENVINHLKTLRHKQLVFVLNKVDLVPTWVTERWKSYLEKEYPTVAFHANINNPFGKSSLINLLRQFSKLHSDKKQISIGLVGYPNTGKSSIINTLKQKKVCNVAPIPGETRVWQYVALMKRIYLIDCPGIVYGSKNDSETDIILKGVVRVENVEYCQEHIQAVIDKVRKEYLLKTYNLQDFTDSQDFLAQIAVKSGKLLKGGEPDENTIAKMVLNDWVRGKIPFYNLPPDYEARVFYC